MRASLFFLYIYDGDAKNGEFFTKTPGFKLPSVQMPNDDYNIFVLPSNIKDLMRIFKRQAQENFCNHIWAVPFDLVAEAEAKQKQTHTEL